MRKFDSLILLRLMAVALLVSTVLPEGFSQHFAKASGVGPQSIRNLQVTDLRFPAEEKTVTLKDVLRDLKKRFHFRFAYREGLLDGKVVPASILNDPELEPEVIVEKIFEQCQLQYRQINKKQFTIFSTDAADDVSSKEKVADGTPVVDPVAAPVEITQEVYAITVSGKVTSQEDGQPLPGVNILVKGTTTGTTSDGEGRYTISLPEEGGVLVFSFIGFVTQEVTVTNQTTIDISMISDAETLGEVVITALGIQKEKKALAYSVTEVKGEEFTQAREINVANALSGKIAGVNATGLSTGPGGSSRIIIRGNGSFNGDNQPLYVVNGMPIDNSSPGGSPTPSGGGLNIDRGDGISGINPDDIESISVLKGGTAAALYGARAANGVILITTKKGRAQKGIGVEYNSTYTTESIAVFPKTYQYEYGHGKFGMKPANQSEAISFGRHSWGTKMDGQPYISIDGKEHPYSPVSAKDNIKDFYQNGSTFINTLAFTGGTDRINFRFSLSNTDNKGIVPNSSLNKKIGSLNLNARLGEKITIETVAQYNIEEVENRTMAGDANGNPNWIYMLANTIDADQLKPGDLPDGNEFVWNETSYATNPYFVANKYRTNDKKNRFIGQANIKYDFTEKLFVKGSISRDFYNFNYVGIIPTGTQYLAIPGSGEYYGLKSAVSETNAMITLNYGTEFLQHFNVNAMAGANRRTFTNDETSINGVQFVLPYFYSYTNTASLTTKPNNQRTETNSVFGSVDLDYKGIAFLTLTGRQDWFSTLNMANNTIFYPSVGGSFVLSEAFDLPTAIGYAKLRGSWAQVGGAVPNPYAVNLTYSMVQGGHNGRPLQQITPTPSDPNVKTITDPNLKPLTSTTYEIGIETKLLGNRLGFDFTFYNRKTSDDIVETAVPISSGFNYARLNVGELQNKGIELLVTGTPVKGNNFTWDVSYNVAHNTSKVIKLADGLNTIQMATSVGNWAGVYNDVGRPYGTIKGYRIERNEEGLPIFEANGYERRSGLVELGNGVPPLTMGITNNFTYKRFTLNVLIDGKFGNKVFSVRDTYANRFGLLKRTLEGRENGLVLTGVDAEGNPYQSAVIPYTAASSSAADKQAADKFRLYYDNQKNYSELFTYDGSFIKLRQVIFSYNIPVSTFKFVKLQSASISFVARNLAILYRKTDNFDPESSHTNGNAQGIESFSLPRTRSYGFNLVVKF